MEYSKLTMPSVFIRVHSTHRFAHQRLRMVIFESLLLSVGINFFQIAI
jgi:hypothetical protein